MEDRPYRERDPRLVARQIVDDVLREHDGRRGRQAASPVPRRPRPSTIRVAGLPTIRVPDRATASVPEHVPSTERLTAVLERAGRDVQRLWAALPLARPSPEVLRWIVAGAIGLTLFLILVPLTLQALRGLLPF